VAAIASVVVLAGLIGIYGQLDYNDPGTAMFGSIAIMALGASAVIIGISSTESRFAHVLKSGFLRFFGRYSYAMYVVHTAVLAGLDHYYPFRSVGTIAGFALPAQTAWAFAYVALSVAVAMLSWNLVERHFLRLKRFFPYRPRTAVAAAR
jgi:peptidoglycan/LPS O-acetylase OafA/YrhL